LHTYLQVKGPNFGGMRLQSSLKTLRHSEYTTRTDLHQQLGVAWHDLYIGETTHKSPSKISQQMQVLHQYVRTRVQHNAADCLSHELSTNPTNPTNPTILQRTQSTLRGRHLNCKPPEHQSNHEIHTPSPKLISTLPSSSSSWSSSQTNSSIHSSHAPSHLQYPTATHKTTSQSAKFPTSHTGFCTASDDTVSFPR